MKILNFYISKTDYKSIAQDAVLVSEQQEHTLSKMEAELANTVKQLAQATTELKNQSDVNATLKYDNGILSRNNDSLREQILLKSKKIEELLDNIKSLQIEKSHLTKKQEQASSTIVSLEDSNRDANSELSSARQRISAMSACISKFTEKWKSEVTLRTKAKYVDVFLLKISEI